MIKFLIRLLVVVLICAAVYYALTHIQGGKYWYMLRREALDAYDALRYWISLGMKYLRK